jgi:FKBP-type peptidyl-prolyl cis-trans isomerase FkpA
MGANMGQIVKSKITSEEKLGIEYDQHLIAKGFIAALQNQSQLKEEQIQLITRNVETLVVQKRDELQKKMAEENKAKGLEFLTKNAKRAGIVVTDSGLQYEVLKKGKGSKPRATDTVKVHYLGKLLDGTVFESSYSRDSPAIFPLNRVIKGWIEGLQLMNVGAKYKFYVPSDLAYGARSTDKVVSHSSLIFEVEL